MRVRRADDNQAAVTKALRKIGAAVTPIHTVGKGVADLLVSFRGFWHVLEVKDGAKPPSARALTGDEQQWIGKQKAHVQIVNSAKEAVEFVIAWSTYKEACAGHECATSPKSRLSDRPVVSLARDGLVRNGR